MEASRARKMRFAIDKDLTYRMGPIEPVLRLVDPLLAKPISLSPDEFESWVTFGPTRLLDPLAELQNLCSLVGASLPSGMPPLRFEECAQRTR
jgi:hypothetical protein